MRVFHPLPISDADTFRQHLLYWANGFSYCCYFDSNSDISAYGDYDLLLAAGCRSRIELEPGRAFDELKKFHGNENDFLFGYFSYDLKNETEELYSANHDGLEFPGLCFFRPEFLVRIRDGHAEVGVEQNGFDQERFLEAVFSAKRGNSNYESLNITERVNKLEYIRKVNAVKQHIRKGDIYEMNYCIEFFAENAEIDPAFVYEKLNEVSQTPLSCYCRFNDKYLISASPERFLKKTGNKIISQPIKGTARRGRNPEEDEAIRSALKDNLKEQSENVMIVDLVRNDLSRTAKKDSVKVEELCGVYSFRQVHQMISTVSAELDEDVHFIDAIKSSFPMGSMTGAPKVKAMQLIEKYETAKRGLYSGAVGYLSPEGGFDFNVVIRSILYNSKHKYLSFMTGSAITDKAEAEKEYDECLLKAKAMLEVLGQNL